MVHGAWVTSLQGGVGPALSSLWRNPLLSLGFTHGQVTTFNWTAGFLREHQSARGFLGLNLTSGFSRVLRQTARPIAGGYLVRESMFSLVQRVALRDGVVSDGLVQLA